MSRKDQGAACRLYLVSPPAFDLGSYAKALAAALDAANIACFQLALQDADDSIWLEMSEALVPLVQSRDVAFLLNGHPHLAAKTGADGIHVDGPVGGLRDQLPADAILGAGCAGLRHEAMVSGEEGADYVSFGPWSSHVAETLSWWQETMEPPCVAQGGMTQETAPLAAAAGADFVMLGEAVWDHADGPAEAIGSISAVIANTPRR